MQKTNVTQQQMRLATDLKSSLDNVTLSHLLANNSRTSTCFVVSLFYALVSNSFLLYHIQVTIDKFHIMDENQLLPLAT